MPNFATVMKRILTTLLLCSAVFPLFAHTSDRAAVFVDPADLRLVFLIPDIPRLPVHTRKADKERRRGARRRSWRLRRVQAEGKVSSDTVYMVNNTADHHLSNQQKKPYRKKLRYGFFFNVGRGNVRSAEFRKHFAFLLYRDESSQYAIAFYASWIYAILYVNINQERQRLRDYSLFSLHYSLRISVSLMWSVGMYGVRSFGNTSHFYYIVMKVHNMQ